MKKFMADETGDPVRFGCDGLDNVKKMKELADNQHFINTKICCIGGAEDTIMGDESGLNFVHDLAREARSHFKSERVFEWMQGGRHESYPDGNVLNFLFYNKPTTENEA
jgi:hypothetical protein